MARMIGPAGLMHGSALPSFSADVVICKTTLPSDIGTVSALVTQHPSQFNSRQLAAMTMPAWHSTQPQDVCDITAASWDAVAQVAVSQVTGEMSTFTQDAGEHKLPADCMFLAASCC
jgi:hypothetical protein